MQRSERTLPAASRNGLDLPGWGRETATELRAWARRRLRHERATLPKRVGRARLTGVALPTRLLLFSSWAWSLVVVVVYALLPQQVQPVSVAADVTWTVCILGVAFTTAVALLWLVLQPRRGWSLLAVPVLCCLPVALLTGEVSGPLVVPVWILGILAFAAAVAFAVGVRPASVLLVSAASGCWVLLVFQPLVVLPLFGSAPTVLLFAFPLTATLALVGLHYLTVSGIAEVVRRRSTDTVLRLRADVRLRWAVVAAVAALTVMLLRFTLLRGLFGSTDDEVWTAKAWTAWPHAILIGVLIVVVVIRSGHTPLSRRWQGVLLAGITVSALAAEAELFAGTIATTVAVLSGHPLAEAPDFSAVGRSVTVLGLIAVLILIALPAVRGTAARPAGVLTVLYLLPAVGFLLGIDRNRLPPIWSTTPEVGLVVVIAACVLTLLRLIRNRGIRPGTLIRLAIVPVLVLHAFSLIPALIATPFGRWIAVGALLLVIVTGQPPAEADQRRRARRLAGAAALQLAAPLGLLFTAGANLPDDDTIQQLGLLWLGVALMVLFASQLVPKSTDDRTAHTTARARRLTQLLRHRPRHREPDSVPST